jgi:hypothetical protein
MPARTLVQLPVDHAAAVKRVTRCLVQLVGEPTVDDRPPFGCVSARTEAWLLSPWAFELLVVVDLRPRLNPTGTEAIVSADAIYEDTISELFGWVHFRGLVKSALVPLLEPRASARLVNKVSAALTAEVDIWAAMRRQRQSASSGRA